MVTALGSQKSGQEILPERAGSWPDWDLTGGDGGLVL